MSDREIDYPDIRKGAENAYTRVVIALEQLGNDAKNLALTSVDTKSKELVSEAMMLQELCTRLGQHLEADMKVLRTVIVDREKEEK